MAYDVNRDGFKLRSESHGINDISQISLKIAIQAYFSTYHAVNYNFGTICNNSFDESLKDIIYNRKYYEACSETIMHFHHFIELSLKKILESVHKLFVYEVKDIMSLYKVLKNEISEDEFEDTQKNTVGFNETLERVLELINGNYLPSAEYKFIEHNKQHIKDLNNLRNRLIHRGIYIFPYRSLDELIGNNILPLVMEFVNLPLLKLNGFFWRYKEINCSIDPISEIITEFKNNSTWDIGKIAFLKELGRAAYSDKVDRISFFKSEYKKHKKLFEDMALAHIAPYEIIPIIRRNSPVDTCPVCGLSTLLKNKDTIEVENDSDERIAYEEYVTSVNCIHCSFEILYNNIENPSAYGYDNLPDWF